jgi:hypothetical protein
MMSSRKGLVYAGLLAAAAGLTGCGGISGSQGVSPANFFMPGVMNRPVSPSLEASLASRSSAISTTIPVPEAQEKPMASNQTSSGL